MVKLWNDRRGREIFLKGVRSELKTPFTKKRLFCKFDENRRKILCMLKTVFSWKGIRSTSELKTS